jgi:hypothetical protein
MSLETIKLDDVPSKESQPELPTTRAGRDNENELAQEKPSLLNMVDKKFTVDDILKTMDDDDFV